MKEQKIERQQAGLTLMELVIAIIVAIALGTGGLLVYKDLTGQSNTANKNDLAAKVNAAIVVYMGQHSELAIPVPRGDDIVSPEYLQNVECVAPGVVRLKSDPTVSVRLLTLAGVPLSWCSQYAYAASA